jgi:hypothetical protein
MGKRYTYYNTWCKGEAEKLVESIASDPKYNNLEWFIRDPIDYVKNVFLSKKGWKLMKKVLDSCEEKEGVKYTKDRLDYRLFCDLMPPMSRFMRPSLNRENLLYKNIPVTYR